MLINFTTSTYPGCVMMTSTDNRRARPIVTITHPLKAGMLTKLQNDIISYQAKVDLLGIDLSNAGGELAVKIQTQITAYQEAITEANSQITQINGL